MNNSKRRRLNKEHFESFMEFKDNLYHCKIEGCNSFHPQQSCSRLKRHLVEQHREYLLSRGVPEDQLIIEPKPNTLLPKIKSQSLGVSLTRMLIGCDIPLRILDNPEFVQFLRNICKDTTITSQEIKNRVLDLHIPDYYNQLRSKCGKLIEQNQINGNLSLHIHKYDNYNFMVVAYHSMNCSTILLSCKPLQFCQNNNNSLSDYISIQLKIILDEWNQVCPDIRNKINGYCISENFPCQINLSFQILNTKDYFFYYDIIDLYDILFSRFIGEKETEINDNDISHLFNICIQKSKKYFILLRKLFSYLSYVNKNKKILYNDFSYPKKSFLWIDKIEMLINEKLNVDKILIDIKSHSQIEWTIEDEEFFSIYYDKYNSNFYEYLNLLLALFSPFKSLINNIINKNIDFSSIYVFLSNILSQYPDPNNIIFSTLSNSNLSENDIYQYWFYYLLRMFNNHIKFDYLALAYLLDPSERSSNLKIFQKDIYTLLSNSDFIKDKFDSVEQYDSFIKDFPTIKQQLISDYSYNDIPKYQWYNQIPNNIINPKIKILGEEIFSLSTKSYYITDNLTIDKMFLNINNGLTSEYINRYVLYKENFHFIHKREDDNDNSQPITIPSINDYSITNSFSV